MKKNRNFNVVIDSRYKQQQEEIKRICSKYGLIVFYPNYHADKNDNNTVIIYTAEAEKFNRELEAKWSKLGLHPFSEEYKSYICFFENSDVNGNFNLDFLNHGKIDCRKADYVKAIENEIREAAENEERKKEN